MHGKTLTEVLVKMDRSVFVALSGAVLQEKKMDYIANNLANVNTAGFKGQKPAFEEALAGPFRHRAFANTSEVSTDLTHGVLHKTDRTLDVAIEGEGFFVVQTPAGERYTRDGSFTLGPEGTLTTRDGHPVLGENGPVALNSPDITVNKEGGVESRGIEVDKLRLVNLEPGEFLREGDLYAAPQGAVPAPAPAETTMAQGYVEASNVNPVRAMTAMIEAQRAFETHAKMIQTIDGMTRKTIDEVGGG